MSCQPPRSLGPLRPTSDLRRARRRFSASLYIPLFIGLLGFILTLVVLLFALT